MRSWAVKNGFEKTANKVFKPHNWHPTTNQVKDKTVKYTLDYADAAGTQNTQVWVTLKTHVEPHRSHYLPQGMWPWLRSLSPIGIQQLVFKSKLYAHWLTLMTPTSFHPQPRGPVLLLH